MKCHHYIIDKIHSIRQSALTDPSLSDFVRFLANCELFETISSLKLKKLTYDKVHTSKFFVNVTNSQLALDEYEKLNNLKLELTFHIKSLAVKLVNLDCEAELLRHFMDMKPSIFLN